MIDLLNILEEHCELLQQRGYEEIGLGSLEEPGIYLQQLEQVFSHQIQEAQFNKSIREFDVRAVGFFNEEKDVIDFLFHYEFNPREGTIDLKSFTAEMDGVAKKFVLEQSIYNLPPVATVLSILSEGRDLLQQNPVAAQNKQIAEGSLPFKDALTEHYALLVYKGFTNKQFFPYANNFLFKKLEHKLEKKYTADDTTPDFLIRIQGLFNDQSDEVKYNFFYSIDRTNHVLQMNAMMAELKDKRIFYPIKEVSDLPPAMNVWLHLTHELKEENVQVIYPKEQIKMLLREQERFLGSFGYYKTFFGNHTNFIERELQGLLEKSLNEKEQQIIPINRQIHLNLHDTMHCRFQYDFDPVQVHLALESVTTKIGMIERTYSHTEIANQKLALQEIFVELNEQNRLLNAQKISKGPPDHLGIRAMVKHLQKRPS